MYVVSYGSCREPARYDAPGIYVVLYVLYIHLHLHWQIRDRKEKFGGRGLAALYVDSGKYKTARSVLDIACQRES
jgi:hypothetical protein